MTDEEFVYRLGRLMLREYALRDDGDYEVNPAQMDRFLDLVSFFQKLAAEQGGELEPLALVPKEESAGLTATFQVFDLWGEQLQAFCGAAQCCSAFCVDSLNDGRVCVSMTVPHVFVRKARGV